MQATEVREELQGKPNIVYVPLRSPVCRTCGEKCDDRHTVHVLAEGKRQLKDGKAELPAEGKELVYGWTK